MLKKISVVLVIAMAYVAHGQTVSTTTKTLPVEKDHGVLYVRDFCDYGMQFIGVVQRKTNPSQGSGGVSVVQVHGSDGKPLVCADKPAAVN